MPRHESARKANWMTLRVIALLAVAGLILAAAVRDGGDDEERPPIIVNNGSIVFEPDGGFLGLGNKGAWKGKGTEWIHDHPRVGPSILRVRATPNDNVCTDGGQTFRTPVTGSQIQVEYGFPPQIKPGASQTATFSIVKRALQVVFSTAPEFDAQTQRLVAYKDDRDVRVLTVAVGSTRCTYTRKVKLAIAQLR